MKKIILILTMMFLGIFSVYAAQYCNHYCKPIIVNNLQGPITKVHIHAWSSSEGNSIDLENLNEGSTFDSSARNDDEEQHIIGGRYSYSINTGVVEPKSSDDWSIDFTYNGINYGKDKYSPFVDNHEANRIANWGGDYNMTKPLVCDGVISFNDDGNGNIYVSISIDHAPAMKYYINPA